MTTQEEFTHLSQVFDHLGEAAARLGMDEKQEELIEELINRANGLGKLNPEGLDSLLTEFLKRGGGLGDSVYNVGETCIRGAFALGKQEYTAHANAACAVR